MSKAVILGPKQSPARVIIRYIAGRPLNGRYHTDATFTKPATKVINAPWRREPSWWGRKPYWQRIVIRHATPIVIGLGIYFWIKINQLIAWYGANWSWQLFAITIAVAYCVSNYLGVGAFFLLRWKIPKWKHKRQWIKPVQESLKDQFGEIPRISIPRDIHTNEDSKAIIALPIGMTAESGRQTVIENALSHKLAGDYSYDWKWHGANPRVTITPVKQPPEKVGFSELQSHMLAAEPFAPILGIGCKRKVIRWNVANGDGVHMLVSAATGGGKSTLARMIICQWLAAGGLVIIIDFKRVSHSWAKGIPGVIYCRDIEMIHDALIEINRQCMKRFHIIDGTTDDTLPPEYPSVLVVGEEFNATMAKLRMYWQYQEESKQVKIPPSVQSWQDILFTGRQARVHVLGITQMGTVKAVGGPEAREQFTDRVLMRYSPNAGRMLCPDVVLPPSPKAKGAGIYYRSGEWDKYQIGWIEAEEAVAYAKAGQDRLGLVWPEFPDIQKALDYNGKAEPDGYNLPPVTEPPALDMVATEDATEPVTLSQAVTAGIVGDMTLAALRKASQRVEFPLSVGNKNGKLYLVDELERWSRNRPRSKSPEMAER